MKLIVERGMKGLLRKALSKKLSKKESYTIARKLGRKVMDSNKRMGIEEGSQGKKRLERVTKGTFNAIYKDKNYDENEEKLQKANKNARQRERVARGIKAGRKTIRLKAKLHKTSNDKDRVKINTDINTQKINRNKVKYSPSKGSFKSLGK